MINKIIICLDLSAYDLECIKLGLTVAKKLKGVKEIELFHNIRSDYLNDLPEISDTDITKITKRIKEDISKRIDHYQSLFDSGIDITVLHESCSIKSLSSRILNKYVLVIMGNKKSEDGSGTFPIQFMKFDDKKVPLLLCPLKPKLQLQNALLAANIKQNIDLDFADFLEISESFDLKIDLLSVRKLPYSYFPYIDFEEKGVVPKKSVEIVNKPENKIPSKLGIQKHIIQSASDIPKTISTYLVENRYDLFVIRRKRRFSNSFKIGKTTIKLLNNSPNTAILVC